jgi:cell division protein FtsB
MSAGRLVFVVCLVFSFYFLYIAGAGVLRSHQISQEESLARARVEQLEQDLQHLQAVREYVSSDYYVEGEARRKLGYVRDGEVAIVVTSPDPESHTDRGGAWWKRLFPK